MTVSKRTLVTCMLIACLGFSAEAVAQGPDASLPRTMRPVIRGRQAAVSSMKAEATEAGRRILQTGGNAFDAVVGGQAALAVTDFALNGVGSDAVVLVYDASAKTVLSINAETRTPKLATIARSEKNSGGTIPVTDRLLSAGLPGVVDAWYILLDRWGTMSFEQVLQPAIDLAENGFPLSEARAHTITSARAQKILKYPSTIKIYKPKGEAPEAGEIRILEDLTGLRRLTLRLIDFDGRRVLEYLLSPGAGNRVGASFTQGKSVFCKVDGRLEHLLKTHCSPAVEQDVPRVHHARKSARQQPIADRNLAAAVLFVPLDGRQLGSARLGVNGKHFFRARIVNEHNGVAADTVEGKVGHRECRLAANDCIERIAARLQDAAGRLCRFRLHRRHCCLSASHDRAHGPGQSGVWLLGDGIGRKAQAENQHACNERSLRNCHEYLSELKALSLRKVLIRVDSCVVHSTPSKKLWFC